MDRTTTRHIQRILVPLDGSFFAEQALPYAQAIGGNDAELILLEVIPSAEDVRGPLGNVLIAAEEIRLAYAEGIATRLLRSRQVWLGARPKVRCETATGDPAEKIVKVADREHVDLIVMASHGRGAVRRWVIGSVADRVARTSTIPVMVARLPDEIPVEAGEREIRRLLVPLDGSALAAQALSIVKTLAISLQIPVVLVKVSQMTHELQRAMTYGVAVRAETYDELIDSVHAADSEELARAASGLRSAGVSVSEVVVDGPVAETIESLAEPTDVIVMTSHGRGGLRRFVLGSVAEKLIRQGPVPVILVPAVVREEVPATLPAGAAVSFA